MVEDNTLYITGAGVSAESGIPTFRGKDGLWTVGSLQKSVLLVRRAWWVPLQFSDTENLNFTYFKNPKQWRQCGL